MVAFASAVDALAAAADIQRSVAGFRQSLRIGISSGEPIQEKDYYFGTPVVLARRLCDLAEGGRILVAGVTRAIAGNRGGFEFRPLGPSASSCTRRWRRPSIRSPTCDRPS
jgi:class 3 adenylate cyclase